MDAGFLVRGLVWYFVFLFSTTAHEAAHAWAAKRGGDSTAYLGGQVSLDPIPHIRREPFGMVFIPIVSFLLNGGNWMIGWASAPYDLTWALRHPTRAAWMAIAGPAANLSIAIGAALLLRAGVGAGAAGGGGLGEGAAIGVSMILTLMVLLNLVLFFFNLIPIPPLDGGSAVGIVLPEDLARRVRLAFLQPGVALAGMVLAYYFGGRLISPAVSWAMGVLLN